MKIKLSRQDFSTLVRRRKIGGIRLTRLINRYTAVACMSGTTSILTVTISN